MPAERFATARIKNLDSGVAMGAIMVNGTLTVCSNIASTTLWFNNYDCRCRERAGVRAPALFFGTEAAARRS